MADCSTCFVCDKVFQHRKTLYAHIRRMHDIEPNIEGTVKCPLQDCSLSFNVLAKLRAHVQEKHMVAVVREEIEFQSMDDFLKWKSEEEKTAKCSFVKNGGAKHIKGGTKVTYVCNRSGIFRSHSKGERLPRSQGSCKMGGHCTAGLEVNSDKSGICTVVYFKTHFGHELNIGFLRLSRTEREVIAGKIAEGVTFQRILDDVRDSIHSEEVERIHLITRKDLHNIQRGFGIGVNQYHTSDEISVNIFLERIKDSVLMFKKSGDNMDNLSTEDTVIVVMTRLQCDLLQKFGSNIVCVDSTHCTNVYKLLLTTLLVIDEFGSGVPVAFCLSNRENIAIMQQFFTAVRERVGIIKAMVFMSDDTNIFRCTWAHVMGLAENNLLCTWHVDRSWRSNLKKVRGGTNKQAQVYKALRTLLEEPDREKFGELLELFETQLQEDEDTREFGVYFTNHYGFRPQHWAYCFRRRLNINTNMHLEAMHRVLKYCYLDGRTNNRLDKFLLVLMKFVRDKFCERIVKMYKGGYSRRIQQIQERHVFCKEIKQEQITANDDGRHFYVKSKKRGITYTVVLDSLECNLDCRLVCYTCQICVHNFTCSCPDSLINLNICKHIHAVSKIYALHSTKAAKQMETASMEEAAAIVSSMQKQVDAEEIASQGAPLKAKLEVLKSRTDSWDTETRGTVEREVDRLLSLTKPGCSREGPRCASNEKVKVQRIPDKRNIRPKTTFGKPTLGEKSNVAEALKQLDSEVLYVHVGFDHTYCKK